MEDYRKEESEPFLNETNAVAKRSTQRHKHSKPTCGRCQYFATVAIGAVALLSLLANAYLLLGTQQCTSSRNEVPTTYSPAHPYVRHELKYINTHDHEDPFNGPPTDEFDEAWHELLWPTMIRVTPNEMREAGKQSLRLNEPEQESYLGYLETYHQLHCVKRIAQGRWPDRYPDLVAQGKLSDSHFNHCLQVIRKGIMCNGDTTLNTWTWDPRNRTKMLAVPSRPRRCIDWNLMDDWARTRATGPEYELMSYDDDGHLGPDI